jgi:hypothetical protein
LAGVVDERSAVRTGRRPAASVAWQDEIELRIIWRDAVTDESRSVTHVQQIETSRTPGRPDRDVQDELANLLGARARAEAVRLNRLGQYDEAGAVVRQAAMAMPRTEVGQATARELMEDVAPAINHPASPADLKRHYNRSRIVQRSRKDYAERGS